MNACCTVLERSIYSDQLICCAWMKVRHTSSSSSELIPTIWNPLPAYIFCKPRTTGMDSRHGGHHVPQKSSSTTFPRSAALERLSFSWVVKEKSGANGARARIGLAIMRRASTTVAGSAFGAETYAFISARPSGSRSCLSSPMPRSKCVIAVAESSASACRSSSSASFSFLSPGLPDICVSSVARKRCA